MLTVSIRWTVNFSVPYQNFMWVCQKFMWVQSIFSVGPIKILCRFSQFFIPILSYYFILPLCRQIKVPASPIQLPRRHFLAPLGVPSACTCCAVARSVLEKKERGSYNSHPSFLLFRNNSSPYQVIVTVFLPA